MLHRRLWRSGLRVAAMSSRNRVPGILPDRCDGVQGRFRPAEDFVKFCDTVARKSPAIKGACVSSWREGPCATGYSARRISWALLWVLVAAGGWNANALRTAPAERTGALPNGRRWSTCGDTFRRPSGQESRSHEHFKPKCAIVVPGDTLLHRQWFPFQRVVADSTPRKSLILWQKRAAA